MNNKPFQLRPENEAMKNFLAENGIDAKVKYARDGSMKGTWYLHGKDIYQKWTEELRAKLTELGFTDFDGKELGRWSGNGGTFSVSVRGHNEMLEPAIMGGLEYKRGSIL